MTTTKNSKTTAPLAHRVPKEVSATISEYSAWLESQTGVKIDALSVYLGSQLRGTWQKSPERQAALDVARDAREQKRLAWIEARLNGPALKSADTKVKPAAKAVTKTGSTLATAEGVVVTEQKHIDLTKAVQA